MHKKTYQCWQDMKQRCYNPNSSQYHNYGGRGISVCARWLSSFSNFLSDMGEKPDGLSIDRIDVNGNYTPENCRWVTNAEQQSNRRDCIFLSLDGKTLTVEEWSRRLGIHPTTIRSRVRRGASDPLKAERVEIGQAFSGEVKKPHINNKAGYRGVCRSRDKWRAQMKVKGVKIYLGTFDTPEDAHAAYLMAMKENGNG